MSPPPWARKTSRTWSGRSPHLSAALAPTWGASVGDPPGGFAGELRAAAREASLPIGLADSLFGRPVCGSRPPSAPFLSEPLSGDCGVASRCVVFSPWRSSGLFPGSFPSSLCPFCEPPWFFASLLGLPPEPELLHRLPTLEQEVDLAHVALDLPEQAPHLGVGIFSWRGDTGQRDGDRSLRVLRIVRPGREDRECRQGGCTEHGSKLVHGVLIGSRVSSARLGLPGASRIPRRTSREAPIMVPGRPDPEGPTSCETSRTGRSCAGGGSPGVRGPRGASDRRLRLRRSPGGPP